jgi:hypothetical protein
VWSGRLECLFWVDTVEKRFWGLFRATLIQGKRQTRNIDQDIARFDSIIAFRQGTADFFDSIGHKRKSSPRAHDVCFPPDSGPNSRRLGRSALCQTRTSSAFYSITSSARASNVGGMFKSSALAVLRLITSSNFVGCSIGWVINGHCHRTSECPLYPQERPYSGHPRVVCFVCGNRQN